MSIDMHAAETRIERELLAIYLAEMSGLRAPQNLHLRHVCDTFIERCLLKLGPMTVGVILSGPAAVPTKARWHWLHRPAEPCFRTVCVVREPEGAAV